MGLGGAIGFGERYQFWMGEKTREVWMRGLSPLSPSLLLIGGCFHYSPSTLALAIFLFLFLHAAHVGFQLTAPSRPVLYACITIAGLRARALQVQSVYQPHSELFYFLDGERHVVSPQGSGTYDFYSSSLPFYSPRWSSMGGTFLFCFCFLPAIGAKIVFCVAVVFSSIARYLACLPLSSFSPPLL